MTWVGKMILGLDEVTRAYFEAPNGNVLFVAKSQSNDIKHAVVFTRILGGEGGSCVVARAAENAKYEPDFGACGRRMPIQQTGAFAIRQ